MPVSVFVGSWSVCALVALVFMVCTGVVLLVALMVTALSGGFVKRPPVPPPAPPMRGSLSEAYREAAFEIAAARAGLSASGPFGENVPVGEPPPPKPPPCRKTGLWQLLAAMLACVPAAVVWALVDSPGGRSAPFTVGAALNLLLLAAQIFFIVWYRRLRRAL